MGCASSGSDVGCAPSVATMGCASSFAHTVSYPAGISGKQISVLPRLVLSCQTQQLETIPSMQQLRCMQLLAVRSPLLPATLLQMVPSRSALQIVLLLPESTASVQVTYIRAAQYRTLHMRLSMQTALYVSTRLPAALLLMCSSPILRTEVQLMSFLPAWPARLWPLTARLQLPTKRARQMSSAFHTQLLTIRLRQSSPACHIWL